MGHDGLYARKSVRVAITITMNAPESQLN